MSETIITGGSVAIEDAVKKPGEGDPQYWLSKKVRVELSFSTPEGGDDDFVDTVAKRAASKVAELLGQAAPTVSSNAGTETTPTTRKRRTKAEIEADEAAKKTGPEIVTEPLSTPEDLEEFDPTADIAPAQDPKGNPVDDASVITDEDFSVGGEDEPITDADLNAAVQKKNAELGNPAQIKALISTFNPDPTKVFQLRQIDAGQRADFIAKLGALTKTA